MQFFFGSNRAPLVRRSAVWALSLVMIATLFAVTSATAKPLQSDGTAAPQQTDETAVPQPEEAAAVDQQGETQPPPAQYEPPKRSAAGAFAQGRKRIGFYGGAGSSYSHTYLILGAGVGYYLLDGFEVGLEFEGWLLQTPQFYKLAPQVRYVFWQLRPVLPYVGAFYRKTWVTDDFPDTDSWGGRAGIAYSSGKGYAAVGVVYESFIDSVFEDHWYPEIAFWLTF
jgi:hypothetical protein